jgi:hypothetical protein
MRAFLISMTLLSVSIWASSAVAGTWALGQGQGECVKSAERAGGAKYCHNCKTAGGTGVRWTFERKCDGTVAGSVTVTMPCAKKVPAEGAQLRALQALARAKLPAASTACPGAKVATAPKGGQAQGKGQARGKGSGETAD